MRSMQPVAILATLIFCFAASAGEVVIDESDSILAIVTHKGGFASGRAHNHMATAVGYEAHLVIDSEAPLGARFELELPTERLEIDRWDLQQAWYPRLEALGVLDEPFRELSKEKRAKIRDTMLSKKQLHAAEFPRITARVASIAERVSKAGEVSFPYAVTLALTVRGRTVERTVTARYEVGEGRLTIEAVGRFRFTDFGIKPFSAFLGAVKNQDEFHVYLHLSGSLAED